MEDIERQTKEKCGGFFKKSSQRIFGKVLRVSKAKTK
jgi:hypothetical protein